MKLLRSALLLLLSADLVSATVLMDSSGALHRQIPIVSTASGVVAIISSPGTPSLLGTSDEILSLMPGDTPCLSCRGATLTVASAPERMSLTTTSLVAGAVIVDGITEGDVEIGLQNTRHARTLTALLRTRLALDSGSRQTLILGVLGPVDEETEASIRSEIREIFDATAAESNERTPSFADMYEVIVLSLQSEGDAQEALSAALTAASSKPSEAATLSDALSSAQSKIREAGVASEALDPPMVAQAYLTCHQAYAKHTKATRSKIAAWKFRSSRGLVVENFGKEAEGLYSKTLNGFDSETLSSAGLPLVAQYRLEMRINLKALIETAIRDLYLSQIINLERSTLKKFKSKLLRTSASSEESAFDDNAAAMRTAAFAFESTVENLTVPTLGLTKDKAVREMSAKLNDALRDFPDSPEAQLKRMRAITKTTSRERKPNSRALDLGLDLVAMIRPDGFGSFQGFAGYNMGGNSLTVGVHNDADDPQVISQFGGVRPPLLRVQPKLRVDLEM